MWGKAMIEDALLWLQNTPLSWAIGDSLWLFPALEGAHVIAAALVFGAIAFLDLRLVYAASRARPVSVLSAEILPLVWVAFAVAVLTGGLMFVSAAAHYGENGPFLIKMGLLLLAGANMAAFHRLMARRAHEWDAGPPPAAARLAGALSLLLWLGVIVTGRWIGFS